MSRCFAIEFDTAAPIPERALRQIMAAEMAAAAEDGELPDDPALHMDMIDDGVEALEDATG